MGTEREEGSLKVDEKRGPWIHAYSGRPIHPLDLKVEDIYIKDIARALSMQCRYMGHANRFYSVAEHCCFVSDLCLAWGDKRVALAGLMHDAAEAYIGDIVRPIKRIPAIYKIIKPIEDDIARRIAERFDLIWPEHRMVEFWDNFVIGTEKAELKNELATGFEYYTQSWYPGGKIWPAIPWKWVLGWAPETAEHEFLIRFSRLAK